MAFEKFGTPEDQEEVAKTAEKLNDIFLDENLEVLENAIRMMGENTRQRLFRAISMAKQKVPDIDRTEDPIDNT